MYQFIMMCISAWLWIFLFFIRPVIQSLCSNQYTLSSLSLHKLWTVPTGKCVDSSPLVVTIDYRPIVYIGSHSGILLAIQLNDGVVIWKTQLPDRLESSPCLSICGHYIIIGTVRVTIPNSLYYSCTEYTLYMITASECYQNIFIKVYY